MRNDGFDSDFFRGMDRGPGPLAKVGIALWALFCIAISLGVTGVVVWAIIQLVEWVTTK